MRYVIYFEGILENGYIRLSFIEEEGIYKTPSIEDSLTLATKFRFKWCAQILCFMFNKSEKGWKVYSVKSVK